MGKLDAALVERVAENIDYILAGHEGEPNKKPPFKMPGPQQDGEGNEIWMRDVPHPGDTSPKDPEAEQHLRVSRYADCELKYDDRFVFEKR
ncbi:MAG: hypothetical protein LUH45_06330 [Clostridiales bacterium]|nr:hypothetical protein [Clostridiales bacterium]